MDKNCKTCDYGSVNEISDIVCTNSDSDKCCDFVNEADTCQHWQNYDLEFWGNNTDVKE